MATQYFCRSLRRRTEVLTTLSGGKPVLNGIDFLEVASPDERTLNVNFLFNLPGQPNAVPPLPAPVLTADNVVIAGGVRITGIKVLTASSTNNVLTVTVNAAGDYSTYTLTIVTGPNNSAPPTGFDPQLSSVDFTFKVECPSDFDCKPMNTCLPPVFPAPQIDYLAKDYASFRRLILDRMSQIMPDWRETNPADIGIALVELLAYAGDQLSYYQDAVATEAYLGTARQRISVRRHARLLDYFMHDGCNARVYVFLQAESTRPGCAARYVASYANQRAAWPSFPGSRASGAGSRFAGFPNAVRHYFAHRAEPNQFLYLERRPVLPAAGSDSGHSCRHWRWKLAQRWRSSATRGDHWPCHGLPGRCKSDSPSGGPLDEGCLGAAGPTQRHEHSRDLVGSSGRAAVPCLHLFCNRGHRGFEISALRAETSCWQTTDLPSLRRPCQTSVPPRGHTGLSYRIPVSHFYFLMTTPLRVACRLQEFCSRMCTRPCLPSR